MGSAWWQCAACLRTQEEDVCELQLNHCNLYDVPPDVFIYERTLEKLFLDANRIKDLPRPLFQCHELRVLSLSDNEVGNLPPAIASLINLEYLDLSKNTIKELPDSIKECKNLRSIDISVNPFERFPDSITHIVGLKELYLNDAYIEYLPANFGRLSALKTLELRENNMMTLPKSMSRLVNLQRLDIGNNDFTELPEVVGDLINLTELWIDGNDIRRIPTNIDQLVRLNHFDCTMNAVHLVPSEIQGWRDISIMNLSSNEIYQLPDTLCYLQTVVTLKIDDNQLNALPEEIGQMSSLEELIVTKNFLEYLPPSIGLLRKLHCLNADNNYLRSLPPEIGSCTALSLLSLRSNNLSRVPPELGHLASLRVLNLVNNCIKFLPVSMLNLNCLKALWLSDNQSQPLVPLQQEFNAEEDIMVLSCFMLPQKPRQDIEQMEQPVVGPLLGTVPGTGRRICFAAEVESEGPRQLHRAPTPYPKELRNLARHARNLHHQSGYNQQHLEPETTIREAVVTKATASSSILSNSGSPINKNHQLIKNSSNRSYMIEDPNYTEDKVGMDTTMSSRVYPDESSSDDVNNKTVLAEQKSPPDIREAKCVRNPSSEYIKQPTVADYVNSTWKPDEYSKANTAKIIESDKFAEPYRSTPINGDKGINHFGIDGFKVNDVPPLPPPYHIAAAFSKKAILFQQINNNAIVADQPRILSSSSSSSSKSQLKSKSKSKSKSKLSSLSTLVKFENPSNLSNDDESRGGIEEEAVCESRGKDSSKTEDENSMRIKSSKDEIVAVKKQMTNSSSTDEITKLSPSSSMIMTTTMMKDKNRMPIEGKVNEKSAIVLVASERMKKDESIIFSTDKDAENDDINDDDDDDDDDDHCLNRPSKIPIFKQKYSNDEEPPFVKSINSFDNANDNLKSYGLSSTPTSPITGKKYRLPLNTRGVVKAAQFFTANNSAKKSDNDESATTITILNGGNGVDEKRINSMRTDNDTFAANKIVVTNNKVIEGGLRSLEKVINNLDDDRDENDAKNRSNKDNFSINLTRNNNTTTMMMENNPNAVAAATSAANFKTINKSVKQCAVNVLDDDLIDRNDRNNFDKVIIVSQNYDNINASINAKSKIPTFNNSPSPERKPRLKWMFGPHRNANVFPVQVRKNPGLGFSIAGGVVGAETGIIVTKVNPDGPAQGTLRPGDKILEVDGVDFTKMDHDRAVSVLRATNPVVSMMISRHP